MWLRRRALGVGAQRPETQVNVRTSSSAGRGRLQSREFDVAKLGKPHAEVAEGKCHVGTIRVEFGEKRRPNGMNSLTNGKVGAGAPAAAKHGRSASLAKDSVEQIGSRNKRGPADVL